MQNANQLKAEICDVGSRLWQRGLVAGSDGNISARLTETEVLCTPTMHSKGRLHPEVLCLVDMEGNQLAGTKKRSSEILLHLEIMRARPDVQAVVHCHPPHASAFAITGKEVPRGIMPEAEVFLGEIPLAPYETPGTATFARTVLPFVLRTNVCMLANHGTVTFADTLEFAYHLTEYLEAYCRILLLSQSLGSCQELPPEKLVELTQIRRQIGVAPPGDNSSTSQQGP